MQKYLAPVLVVVVAMAFACQKEKGDTEEAEPKPEPTQPDLTTKVATASIASVQILENCPDAEAPASKAARGPAKRRAPAESAPASMTAIENGEGGYQAPCRQSTVQVSFEGQGAQPSKVVLKELRLLTADGKELGSLSTRLPSKWGESVYTPWNEVLEPDSDLKASYKITPPNWSEVEGKLGGSSHGVMFILEAIIDVGGKDQTVRSSEFARYRPTAVPT
jgi:hypothetical protein